LDLAPEAKRTELRGPRIFDFQIAATMLAHGVTKLITYNGRDFIEIPEIEILEPELATGTQ
jgi:predicted nucleic acid-binding protein